MDYKCTSCGCIFEDNTDIKTKRCLRCDSIFIKEKVVSIQNLIEDLIRERQEQNKECIYLVIGKYKYQKFLMEIGKLHIYEEDRKRYRLNIYNGLTLIIVNSDILEVVGEGEI